MSPFLLQARIATAVAAAIADRGQRAIGAVVGADPSTISRWGSDLSRWPASALLALACEDAPTIEALRAGLADDATAARSGSVQAAFAAIASSADMQAELARDLADGRIDATERTALIPLARASIQNLSRLLAALESEA